jgi:cold shock CspA family protein
VNKEATFSRHVCSGVVLAYDEDVGLGEIGADEGGTYPFHATTIAGDARTIAAGTRVVFVLVCAPRGRIEAAEVTPR